MDFWPVSFIPSISSSTAAVRAWLIPLTDLRGSKETGEEGRRQTGDGPGPRKRPRLQPASLSFPSFPEPPSLAKAPSGSPGAQPLPLSGAPGSPRGLWPTMPVAMEIFGFFLTAVGLLMLGVTLAHSSWRVSTVHGNVITTNTIFENLWYSCATDSMGVHNCWEFPSMLALSGTGWGEPKGAEGGGRLERPQGGRALPVVGPWAPYSPGKPDAVRRPASCSQECWGHLSVWNSSRGRATRGPLL